MARDDHTPSEFAPRATVPAPIASPRSLPPDDREHLVVVTTRALDASGAATGGSGLRTRFWHPRDLRWSENDFASLEHALRLFVDESGWRLLQDQALDAVLAREWIFLAQRSDFTGPTQEQMLSEIGLTPERVTRLLDEIPGSRSRDG